MPLRFEIDHDPFEILVPSADDDGTIIDGLGEAVGLAIDLASHHVDDALVLLDERRRITAVLLDPPAPVTLLVGWCDLPCLEVPFCQTIHVVRSREVIAGPVLDDDREAYLRLRRVHMLQGLQLLDVIMVDGERVRSLAVSCDPDPIWFEPFEPFEPAA